MVLRRTVFYVFIVMVSSFSLLSTDLILPAFPEITTYFSCTEAQTNLTMILFMAVLAIATLFWGPISDRYGRRPVLLIGTGLYFAGSVLCAFSPSITFLIVFRMLQAFGGGAANAVATAIVRDVFDEEAQVKALAVVQSMIMIGPAVAPIIGALLLRIANWQATFFVQAIFGIVVIVGACIMKETNKAPLTVSLFRSLGRLGVVLSNKRFLLLMLLFTLAPFPMLAYVNGSPYIYQNGFGMSSQTYSFFFAATGLVSIFGPMSYSFLARKFTRKNIPVLGFSIMAATGFCILISGYRSPWLFLIFAAIANYCMGFVRPLGTFLMLNTREGDSGSASSLIGASSMLAGSCGMIALSLFTNYLFAVGIIFAVCGLLAVVLWKIYQSAYKETIA
ncbi:MAG: multidrug effflux MFS transporter [Clostridiales Family XIII bacterium]|jgi:DHA1 family bicyclomycin/chloramphenicol resistance-like MFS transporter|nr:multidrug effflux MFS transporter [Clostridiales Family XIII bacterium]